VTGPPALQHDITPVLKGDLRRGGALALVLAVVLLIAVLGICWAALIPFSSAGRRSPAHSVSSISSSHHFLMVLYVPNVVELIGLALAIDYSLFIVHRFRTEVQPLTT